MRERVLDVKVIGVVEDGDGVFLRELDSVLAAGRGDGNCVERDRGGGVFCDSGHVDFIRGDGLISKWVESERIR